MARKTISRRRFVQATGAAALSAGLAGSAALAPGRAHAQQKTLKII